MVLKHTENAMDKKDEQKFGLYVFLGFAFGGVLGLLLGAVSRNMFTAFWTGALAGVAVGWFAAAATIQQNKK